MFKNKKYLIILTLIVIFGAFLRFYKIQENLIFNGEMGYDYMTIRDHVERGQIPLIGPRTSHEWFFIGPLFYWIFGILLPIFNYSVFVGAYFFAIVGALSILVCYFVIAKLFTPKAALISSFLLSFSPLWVMLTRDARFNGLTAVLFFLFYYFLVKSTKDKGKSLLPLGLILGVMFSFFPSPILLLPGALVVLFIYRKKINKKYITGGILGLVVPNIPYVIYNATHKFEILVNLLAWIPYRILGFFGLYPKNTVSSEVLQTNFNGLYVFFQQSYLYNGNVLIFVLFLIVLTFTYFRFRRNEALKILVILSAVSYLGLFLHGAPPQHYYLVIFPVPIVLLSLFLSDISKKYFLISAVVLAYLLFGNLEYYFSDNWFYINSKVASDDLTYIPFSLQEKVADFIVNDAAGKKFSLRRVGPLDHFEEDFSLNYKFLLRSNGAGPVKDAVLVYTIYEDTSNLPDDAKIFWVENIAVTKNEKIGNSKIK